MPTVDGYETGITLEDTLEPSRPLTILVGPAGWGGLLAGVAGANGLPGYGTKARDLILRQSVHLDGMWASAVNMAITKHIALGYAVEDSEDSGRRLARGQDLLQTYGTSGLQRGLRDYLTTNAGQFIAIERVGRGRGAKILRLLHLDSLRCYPTNNPAYPLLYETPRGEWRALADHDLIHLTDMPSAGQWYADAVLPLGLCAADRAWETVLKLCAMETYYREKVSGSRNLAIHIVNGISDQQLTDALTSTEEAQARRGFVLYKGSTIIPTLKTEAPVVVTIPLAEIPDGFNVTDERRDAYLRLANAIGMFVGELQPLSGQGLGTGTQTVVLDEAAEGRGMAAWRVAFTEQINERVLPASTTFTFTNQNDVRDRKARAEADKARIDALAAAVTVQALTPAQMANILADEQIIPREFVPQDATQGGTLSNDEKPLSERVQPVLAAMEGMLTKERRTLTDADVDALVSAALKDETAWAWAKQALEGEEVTVKQDDQEKAMFARMGSSGGGGGGGGGGSKLWKKNPVTGKREPGMGYEKPASGGGGAAVPGQPAPLNAPDVDPTALPVRRLSPEMGDAYLRETMGGVKPTRREMEALEYYQGGRFETLNGYMRGTLPFTPNERERAYIEQQRDGLNSLMARSRTTENLEVHRGMLVTPRDPAAAALLASWQPGATFREPAYLSTTLDPRLAQRFSQSDSPWPNTPGTRSVDIRVRVPAGTPAVYMNAARPRGNTDERELLLTSGLTYRVVSRVDRDGGRTEVELEVMPS